MNNIYTYLKRIRLIIFAISFVISTNLYGQITHIGTQTATTGWTSSITINKPSGVSEGDLMIAQIYQFYASNYGIVAPSLQGWQIISSGYTYAANNIDESWDRGTLLYKFADASDAEIAEYTFTSSFFRDAAGAIVAFSGVKLATPGPVTEAFTHGANVDCTNPNGVYAAQDALIVMFAMDAFMATSTTMNFFNWHTENPIGTPHLTLTENYDFEMNQEIHIGAAWAFQKTAGAFAKGFVCHNLQSGMYYPLGVFLLALEPACTTPTVSIEGPTTICVNRNTTLSPTTGGTWVSNNPSVASVTNAGVVTGLSEGTASFTFTVDDADCSNTTDMITVSSSIMPSISSVTANPDTICWQGSTTLTVTGDLGCADHWAWYQYSCGGTPVGTGPSVTITPYPGTYNYYVRGEGGTLSAPGACSSVRVAINEWPTASITGGEQNACVSTTLTATTNITTANYAWYKDDVLIDGQTGQNLLVNQTGSYKVKVTNTATGCARTSYAFPVLSVSSMPVNKTIFAAPSTGCSGTRVNIGISNSESGVYYRLRNDNGDVNIGDAVSGINGVTIYLTAGNLTETTTFNVLAIKGYCTLEMADKPTFTVGPTAPSITSVTAEPDTICWQGSTTLTVTGNLGSADHWAWYQYSCGGTPVGTGPSVTITPYPGTYNYYVRGEGGCLTVPGACSSVRVTTNEWPTASITGGEQNACVSTTLTATTNITTANYAWYKDDVLIDGQTGQNLLVTQTGSYKVKVTNTATGCERTSSAFPVLSVSQMPENRNVFADKTSVCSGSRVNIGISNSQSGVYYRLRNDNGDVNIGDIVSGIDGVTIYLSADNLTETTTFNVLAIKGYCTLEMENKPTVTVATTEPSITSVTAEPASICLGASTTLTITGDLGSATSWKWYSGSCGGSGVGTGTSIVVSPTETTTYYVRAEGGCLSAPGTCSSTTVSINESITASITGGDQNACVSTTLTATTNASSAGYAWYKNDVLMDGQTGQTLLVTQTGNYKVKVTSTLTGCEETSSAFTVNSVSSMPLNKAVFADKSSICPGTGVNIGITDPQDGVNYQLRNDNGDVNIGDPVLGNKGATIYLPTGALTSTTTFNVLATNGNCTLEMNDKPIIQVGTDNFEPNNSLGTASLITVGEEVSANLSSSKDLDWFQFSTTSAGYYTINFNTNGGSGTIDLLNAKSQKLRSGTKPGMTYDLLAKTTYYIKIYDNKIKAPSPCYSLSISYSTLIPAGYVEANIDLKEGEIQPIIEGIITIWPNPTRNEFELYNGNETFVQVMVLDAMGRTIETIETVGSAETIVFGSNYTPGIYFVKAIGNGATNVFKLIKQ